MRVTRWTLMWLLVVSVLLTVWIAVATGTLNPNNLFASFFAFLFALVVISVLAIIGAVFLGIFISHRIYAARGFTPFEQEMLRMRDEVAQLREAVDRVAERIEGSDPKGKG